MTRMGVLGGLATLAHGRLFSARSLMESRLSDQQVGCMARLDCCARMSRMSADAMNGCLSVGTRWWERLNGCVSCVKHAKAERRELKSSVGKSDYRRHSRFASLSLPLGLSLSATGSTAFPTFLACLTPLCSSF